MISVLEHYQYPRNLSETSNTYTYKKSIRLVQLLPHSTDGTNNQKTPESQRSKPSSLRLINIERKSCVATMKTEDVTSCGKYFR